MEKFDGLESSTHLQRNGCRGVRNGCRGVHRKAQAVSKLAAKAVGAQGTGGV